MVTTHITTSRTERLAHVRQTFDRELKRCAPGEALPPIRELQKRTGAKRTQLEQILEEFEASGHIERRPRSGIYRTQSTQASDATAVVDLVVCDYTGDAFHGSWYATAVASALAEEAGRREIGLRFHQVNRQAPLRTYMALADKLARGACFLLYAHMPDLAALFQEHQIAVISLNAKVKQRGATDIWVDSRQFVQCELEPLWAAGHERIAYLDTVKLDPEVVSMAVLLRREAYYRCMAERGLRVAPHWVAPANGDPKRIFDAMATLFSAPPYPTAVIVSDSQLPTVYRYIESRGWRVGQDVSVMGSDDLPEALQVYPPATTVRHPREIIATQAFESMSQLLAGSSPPPLIMVEPRCIVRQSIGLARASTLWQPHPPHTNP